MCFVLFSVIDHTHKHARPSQQGAHSKAAEQMTEISTEFIDREFLPIRTNQERRAQDLEFSLQQKHGVLQMHTTLSDITIGEAKDIVANSRKNPLETWRRLRTIVSPERCSLLELQAGMDRWESAVSQYEEKSKKRCTTVWRRWYRRSLRNISDSQLQPPSNF